MTTPFSFDSILIGIAVVVLVIIILVVVIVLLRSIKVAKPDEAIIVTSRQKAVKAGETALESRIWLFD